MTLRLVPPNSTPSSNEDLDPILPQSQPKPESEYIEDSDLSENTRLLIVVFILCFVPLFSYTVGKNQWGHEVGTHIGVAVGAFCVFITCGLLYFANFLRTSDEERS